MSATLDKDAHCTKLLIFVVDDQLPLGELTEALLQTAGYETRLFSDALIARSALLTADPMPTVLVTDYDLGPLKGLDLIATARSVSPTIKCLLVSGTADPRTLLREPVKADLFVAKPFTHDQLIGAVRQLLQADAAAVAQR
jgi:DNA-binding NtrC family response regulator